MHDRYWKPDFVVVAYDDPIVTVRKADGTVKTHMTAFDPRDIQPIDRR